MKAVILAAGQGSRLKQLEIPKALTLLGNGQTILEYQLTYLSKAIGEENILLVVGYQKEKLMESFPNLLFVYSPNYAKENTSKSLLRALKKLNEDTLWINGDVVFHPSVLEASLQSPFTHMIVNQGTVGEEEVKYSTDSKGKILQVSKTLTNGEGEALGINFCSKKEIPQIISCLEQCKDSDYFEKALELAIKQGMEVKAVVVGSNQCAEIDFPEDLERVNNLIKQWNSHNVA